MLFGYPVTATANNWLHDCLVEIVSSIHQRLRDGLPHPAWPECIPDEHRETLRGRHALRNDILAYQVALEGLNPGERDTVLNAMIAQNRVEELVACGCDCPALSDLPEPIRDPIENLFTRGFALLTTLGLRDENYRQIYAASDHHICPFCGWEYFDAPVEDVNLGDQAEDTNAVREDLDHYLPRSRYPFAAANLRNLSPMGGRCNTYKSNKDILRDLEGRRRSAFFPYMDRRVSVNLNDSVPFAGSDTTKPSWTISFVPESPECQTWDSVFCLRQRVIRDVLDPSFNTWLKDFAVWYAREYPHALEDRQIVVAALERYAENEAIKGLNGRDHFRTLVIKMLHRHCLESHERLIALIGLVIKNAVPPSRHASGALSTTLDN